MGLYNTKIATWVQGRQGIPLLNVGLLPKEENEKKGYAKIP